jgi:AcrR family transcriptional regulator
MTLKRGMATKRPATAVAVTRRRGAKLEAALLEAAWAELTAVGYAGFTIEGVASRARTSRAVLYRRWPSRGELVLAAYRQHRTLVPADFADTGSLRGDVLANLRLMSASTAEIVGVLSFLFADYFNETGLPPSELRERVLGGRPTSIDVALERAVRRGEIDADRVTPRIASLPLDLARHEVIMHQAPVPDAVLVEIVDEVFMPLVGLGGTTPRPPKRSTRMKR